MIELIFGGLFLNLLISSGSLWKLIDFARRWGALEEKVENLGRELERMRDETARLREVGR